MIAETVHIDIDTMRTVMSAPFEWFEDLGVVSEGKSSRWRETARHIYIDRGSNVLGVAHLDSVQPFTGFWINKEFIACPTIDNRIGVWLMLYGLPSLGIHIDVLLTENEECGASTAGDFIPRKEYNWGFSFDREGTDVACYQYYDKGVVNLLGEYNLDAQRGSYSDVADLDMGVKCFNFGVGMYSYHYPHAFIRTKELALQLTRFSKFYEDKKDERLPHTGAKTIWDVWNPKTKVTYPKSWDDDWDKGWVKTADGKYEWDDSTEYSYPPDAIADPLISRLDHIDRYYARQAIDEPEVFFGDTNNVDEWYLNHSMGDMDTMDADDETASLYFDGLTYFCDNCENLFVKGDVENYYSLQSWLCKACFYYYVTSEIEGA